MYGPWHHIGAMDAGANEVKVTLNANDHRPFAVAGAPVATTVTVHAH